MSKQDNLLEIMGVANRIVRFVATHGPNDHYGNLSWTPHTENLRHRYHVLWDELMLLVGETDVSHWNKYFMMLLFGFFSMGNRCPVSERLDNQKADLAINLVSAFRHHFTTSTPAQLMQFAEDSGYLYKAIMGAEDGTASKHLVMMKLAVVPLWE